MSETAPQKTIVDEMVAHLVEQSGWSVAECKNFLRCIRSAERDTWLDDASGIIEWALEIDAKHMLIQLAKQGVLTIKMEDGEPAVALNP